MVGIGLSCHFQYNYATFSNGFMVLIVGLREITYS